MVTESMLTTIDNPFNPFENFSSWLAFDIEKGYNCCGKLARYTNNSSEMTRKEELEDIDRAIDTIIRIDFLDIYKKVSREVALPTEAES